MRNIYLIILIIISFNFDSFAQQIAASGLTSSCGDASGLLHLAGIANPIIVKWEEGTYSPGPNRVFTATKTYPGSANSSLPYNVTAPGKKAYRVFYRFDEYDYEEKVTLPIEIIAYDYPEGGTLTTSSEWRTSNTSAYRSLGNFPI